MFDEQIALVYLVYEERATASTDSLRARHARFAARTAGYPSSLSCMASHEVQVLYFAALRDLTGQSEERLALPVEVRTVRDFVQYIAAIRPALAGKLASVRIAIDEAFAKDSDTLSGAQVIAMIPPVAGG